MVVRICRGVAITIALGLLTVLKSGVLITIKADYPHEQDKKWLTSGPHE